MKHWMKRNFVTAVGATLIIGSLTACGSYGRSNMSDVDMAAKQAKMIDYASKKLDLDDAQKQRLSVLADKLREQRTALAGTTTDPRADLQSLVAGATLDKAKAQLLIDEKTGTLRSKSPEVIAAAATFFDSLNPAQQQQVRDMMQRRWGWRG